MDCKHENLSSYSRMDGGTNRTCNNCGRIIPRAAQADRIEALAREIFAASFPHHFDAVEVDLAKIAFAAARTFYAVADQERGKG